MSHPFTRIQQVIFILILALTLTPPLTGRAQNQDGVTMTAQAGFDGTCKEGRWIPVRVTLENNGPGITGRVEALVQKYPNDHVTYAYTIELPTRSRKEIYLYVYSDGYISKIDLQLISEKEVLAIANPRLSCVGLNDLVFGVVANNPSHFNVLSELDPPNGTATVVQIDSNSLPEKSLGLEALDVIVISDIDTGAWNSSQKQALAGWLATGGRLIVAGGPNWQKITAGILDLMPLAPSGTQTIRNLTSFETFANSQQPIDREIQTIIATTGTLNNPTEILVEGEGLPLVVRKRMGYGEVYFLAIDPTLAPIKNWDGAADFYHRLLASGFDYPGWVNGFQNWYTANEAATNLRDLELPSIILTCGFLALYVIVLGPGNYLALRILKRHELAWISIPLLVVAFSGLAFIVGNVSRGRQAILNRLAIVQVWPDTGQAHVDGLVGIYSPRRATYNAHIGDSVLAHPIPDSALSGQGLVFWQSETGVTIPDLRIEVGGIKPLSIEGQIPAPSFSHDIYLTINNSGAYLKGSIFNNSPIELHDAVFLYPGGTIKLGDMSPGESHDISISLTKAQLSGQAMTNPFYYTLPAPFGVPPPPTYPYYNYYDTTMEEIIGSSSYYDDINTHRRYLLLGAALDVYSTGNGRGAGLYLSGWSDESPIDINLENQPTKAQDTTLYLISLTPTINLVGETLKLPPGLFFWSVFDPSSASNSDISPYGGYLYTGETKTVQFSLGYSVQYSSLESLILHLKNFSSSTSSTTGLSVSLWDFTTNQWEQVPDIKWGDTTIPNPERFVGPNSTIRLRIENQSTQWVQFDAADFTLVVTR